MEDESVGLDSQGKGFSDGDAQRGSTSCPFRGARVVWSKHTNSGMRTTGGALTRVRSCQGRPGRVRTGGRERLAGLGSDREGVELGSHGAVSGSDRGQKTKGHA